MKNLAVVGAQWGDEGKAKIVDTLAAEASIVARYQGGANAGHTVVEGGRKFVFHLVPAGILRRGLRCVLGNGVVFDPAAFLVELDQLSEAGVDWLGRVFVSTRAHVVMPYHRILDGLAERRRSSSIGTTRRGIGPCYASKATRHGILVGDLLAPARLREKIEAALDWLGPLLEKSDEPLPTPEGMIRDFEEIRPRLEPCVADVSGMLLRQIEEGGGILFEGAQGMMLDVDHGTYPYVTSSNTTTAGIAPGLGIPPKAVEEALGITKAYTTRVGAGWFPTEELGEMGEALRRAGKEYGATTGRPRRCGWLDLVALRHAVRLSGIDSLAMTKIDVLGGFPSVKSCVAYRLHGREIDSPPADPSDLEHCQPIYRELQGWPVLTGPGERLPEPAKKFLDFVADTVRVPISLVSTGPDRSSLQVLNDPWRR